jgi:hypothetical protein
MAGRIVMTPATAQRWAVLATGLVLAACTANDSPRQTIAFAPAAPPPAMLAPAPAPAPEPQAAASPEVVWALRGGLNVAALICNDRSITDNYNQLLKSHRNLLNDAYAAEQARYRSLHGQAGPARHDAAMTRLYNGFASLPDRRRFCTMASRIAADAVTVPSDVLARSARRALSTLEPGAVQLVLSGN